MSDPRIESGIRHLPLDARDPAPKQWWELEQHLNELLGLDPYGEEPGGGLWGGRRSAVRRAVLLLHRKPRVIERWLERSGEEIVLKLSAGSGPMSHDLFDELPDDPAVRRLHRELHHLEILLPSEKELEEEEFFDILIGATGPSNGRGATAAPSGRRGGGGSR